MCVLCKNHIAGKGQSQYEKSNLLTLNKHLIYHLFSLIKQLKYQFHKYGGWGQSAIDKNVQEMKHPAFK